jgi:hypothetical protein
VRGEEEDYKVEGQELIRLATEEACCKRVSLGA